MHNPSLMALERPRIGQRLSLRPGPHPRPQRYWRNDLPWDSSGEFIPDRLAVMRIALGCDDGSFDSDFAFRRFIADLRQGRLFLRVVPLSRTHRVSPGQTPEENQARMDRWLPPPLRYIASTGCIQWGGMRMGSLLRNRESSGGITQCWIGDVTHQEVHAYLTARSTLARWLDNGQVWIVGTAHSRAFIVRSKKSHISIAIR